MSCWLKLKLNICPLIDTTTKYDIWPRQSQHGERLWYVICHDKWFSYSLNKVFHGKIKPLIFKIWPWFDDGRYLKHDTSSLTPEMCGKCFFMMNDSLDNLVATIMIYFDIWPKSVTLTFKIWRWVLHATGSLLMAVIWDE